MPAWVRRLSYEDAPPPERWFNRAFLTAYAIAGALGVYAWESTVSACSNPQYHRPHDFSCPSTARIAFTWALLGVLIGTMFASRFVLWRRLRSAYVPLLAIMVLIAGVAVLLITHHPKWGVAR
jgi:hypothetical protein